MQDLTLQILVDHLCVEPEIVEPHAMLSDDLGADSLDFVELQMVLEDMGIDAPDEAFSFHMTVADFDKLVAAGAA